MTREEALIYEENLHRRYFEPFDRLLEKKAQYYLDKQAEGKDLKPLLNEIEVLEQFREYTVMLETLLQEAIDGQGNLAEQVLFWKQKWESVEWWERCAMNIFSHYECLQEQCKQP